VLTAVPLVLALVPLTQDAPLSKSDASELRELYLEALADPSGKATRKLTAFGKKCVKKSPAAELITALREGPKYASGSPKARGKGKKKEDLEDYGTTVTGYRFEHDGDEFGYLIDYPRKYSPKEATPVLLDPGHGGGANKDQKGKADFMPYWRNQTRGSELEGALIVRTEIIEQVGAGGLRGGLPEDEVSQVFDAFFRDLASRVHIDPERIYVSGLSQTGFWAWYLGRSQADRFAGIAPMGAVTWQVNGYLENYTNLGTFVLHGANDATCPVAQPRATCAEMVELGLPVEYREIAEGAHDFSTWGVLPEALGWLLERGPRDPYPPKVAKRLQTERTPWCYWVRVDALKKEADGRAATVPTAFLTAEYAGQVVELTSEGVKSIELCLASEMLDLDQDVRVVWNGKTVHEGPVERDLERALEVAVEKADWHGTFEVFLELKAPR
jgi:dienelactone hydrolase